MSSEPVNTVYGPLPPNLNFSDLDHLCLEGGVQTGPFGSQLHQEDYVIDGTPIITVEHLGENRITHSNLPRISDKDKARLSKYSLKTGDIVFSRVGSVDRRALVQPAEDGWLFSGRCLRVRPNPEVLDSRWLSYFFGLPAFKNYIRGIAVGATMPSINTKILSEVPIYFPEIQVQRQASTVLTYIDDRIALLRETNATLESIAQALFKSWFVDFDPVNAKAEGREPEGISAEIARLFPSRFDASGLIPHGWSHTTLGQVCARHGGSIQTGPFGSQLHASDYVDAGIPVIMPKDLANRRVTEQSTARIRQSDADRLSRHKVRAGDIVFSRRGDVERHALIGNFEADWICGTGCLLVRPGSAWPSATFLSMALDEQGARKWLVRHAVGATMPNLNTGILANVPLVMPETEILEAFENIIASTEEKRSANYESIQVLTALRDTLLPRLVFGQLRLPEAEAMLQDAA